MSELEQAAKPLLTPVFRGDEASWYSEERKTVAAWTFKTALMLDRSSAAAYTAPLEHFAYLWRKRLPPPSIQVALARYFPSPGEEPIGVAASSTRLFIGDRRVPEELRPYEITFSVGQVVFQVAGHTGIESRGFGPVARWGEDAKTRLWVPIDEAFMRMWPGDTSEAVKWPPGVVLDTTSLKAVARLS